MVICQSFSERENSYVAKRYLKRKIFYPISSDLEALGLGIYQANFVNSTHQTSQALVIQDFRCLRKSNFRQSRSLIFPFYPIARVRWCYTRSELITVCNFHSVRWYFPWIENYGYGFGYGSDYVLRLQKASGISLVNLSSSFKHGWSKDGRIQWTETSFPDDVRRMKRMINNEDNDDE